MCQWGAMARDICISHINVSAAKGISIIHDRDGISESFLLSLFPPLNTGALTEQLELHSP
jgi:hypothetical protein